MSRDSVVCGVSGDEHILVGFYEAGKIFPGRIVRHFPWTTLRPSVTAFLQRYLIAFKYIHATIGDCI